MDLFEHLGLWRWLTKFGHRTLVLLAIALMCPRLYALKKSCEGYLLNPFMPSEATQIFQSSGESARRMAFDFQPGAAKAPVFLIIHGLGDDMSNVQSLAAQAKQDGYGVLRVDLHGHGATLNDYLNIHGKLPLRFDFQDNIDDIVELIHSLNITDLVIVGHSYGGGIAFGVASQLVLEPSPIRVRSVSLLGPYVQRIDKFLREYFSSPAYAAAFADQTSQKVPEPVYSIMDPLFQLVQNMFSSAKLFKDTIDRIFNVDGTIDFLMDPWLDNLLRQSYEHYFVKMTHKSRLDLTREEKEEINLKVEAALKVTKGIRSFDLLDETQKLPESLPPIQIIGGTDDQLVVPRQLELFARRLRRSGIKCTLEFEKGASHLFPQERSQETYDRIIAFVPKNKTRESWIKKYFLSTTASSVGVFMNYAKRFFVLDHPQ